MIVAEISPGQRLDKEKDDEEKRQNMQISCISSSAVPMPRRLHGNKNLVNNVYMSYKSDVSKKAEIASIKTPRK